MEATKVQILPRTFELNKLKGKRKTQLRRKLIIEYIESKPAGEIISVPEFQRVGSLSTTANAHSFINRMLRDGIIMRHAGDKPRTYFYSVIGAIRVKKEPQQAQNAPQHNVAADKPDIGAIILQLAKDYMWDNPEGRTLRSFVEYVTNRSK